MKSTQLSRAASWSLHFVVTILAIGLFGPVGAFAAILNPHSMSGMLGASYTKVNATTVSDLTTMTDKARQELWVRRIVLGADTMYQDNPFADNMLGGKGSGKPIIQITETEKVAGNLVNVPTIAGFGGPGVAGEGDRIGAEQKLRIGNFQVKIGRFWFGVGFTAVARDETVIGGGLDEHINEGLRQQMAKKKSDDIMMRIKQRAGTSGRNYLLPYGVSSRAALYSNNVMNTTLITQGALSLTSNGGKPWGVTKDKAGSTHSRYVLLGTNHGLSPLDTEDAYLDARIQGGVRGGENGIFTGAYDDWLGHGIYRWEQIDHGNFGPVGSPLFPRAFLGDAITNCTTGTFVTGGGSAAAALVTPAPKYFEFFSNALYTFFNGDTIAAVTNVTRYLMIINPDGSYGVWPYRVNDGNKITIYSTGQVLIGIGTETDDYVEGALVQECNILGVPFCGHIYLAQEAMCCGRGTINGSVADPQMGKRTEEHRNHDMDHGIGVEAVWGCEAVKRPDNVYPGFVYVETACPIPGAPTVLAA